MSHLPEIFKIKQIETKNSNINYILLGSDGVYDCFSKNEQITSLINSMFEKYNPEVPNHCHLIVGKAVDKLLKTCISKECSDNISAILVCFNCGKN